MDLADSRTGQRDVFTQIKDSKDCVRRSLELIEQSDRIIRECESLLIMARFDVLDAAAIRKRYGMFYVPRDEELQPCAVP